MFTYKKIINSDLLHLALIFTLLRLDLDSYLDGGLDDRLETHDVFLGANLAYSPTLYHNLYNPFNEYVHPKSIDSALYDRYSIFAELNSLGRYDRFRPTSNDIFAYLVDQDEKESQNPPERSMPDSSGNPSESANTNNEEYNNGRNEAVTEMGSVSSPESLGSSHISVSSNSELSYEDMNLIEILWKQDIDLGITKDAFEGRTSLEINKSKQIEDSGKKKKEPPTETQIQPPPFDPWEGVDYTIDGETGEHIILDPSANQCLNDDDCTFNDFDFQQIAEELQNVPLEEAIHFFNDQKSENNTHTCIEKDTAGFGSFQDLRYENFTTDINMTLYDGHDDSLFNEFQELDSLLNKNTENNSPENQVSDRYLTDTENCWQDFTPALTVSPHVHINQNDVLQQQSRSPDIVVPENNSIIPDISNVNTNFSDMFDNVLLQNATLAFSDPNSYQNTGQILVDNATSLFNALSNHTDPTMENTMNITYDQNLPELFGPDNSTNSDFLSNLLFDEDLQLMDISLDKDGYNIPVNKLVDDHPDSSSDTFASSMSSENNFDSDCMNSISGSSFIQDDHIKTELSSSPSSSSSSSSFKSSINNSSVNCNPPIAQKKYKLFGKKTLNFQNGNVDFRNDDDEYGVNNPKHFGLEIHNKSNYDNEVNHLASEASMQRIQDNTEHQHDYDSSITTRNFAQHVNHNHTYNMPFETTDLKRKPITRDKNDFEDELGRDERRARLLKIPISNEDIIHLPIDEFNERLSKYDLGEEQLSLIRDIRRRGKNKVAAQNCRKRKLGQIVDLQQELEILLEQKAMMQAEREKLLTYRCIVREKYNKLYDLVVRSTLSDPPPPRPPNFSHQFTIGQRNRNMSIPSNSTSIDSDMDSSKGARSKRKVERK